MLVLVLRAAAGPHAHVRAAGARRGRRSRAAAPAVLRVGDHLRERQSCLRPVHTAIAATFAAARGRRAGGRGWARRSSRARTVSAAPARGSTPAARVAAAASLLVAVLAGGLVAAGNPVTRVRTRAGTASRAATAPTATGSRLAERARQQPLRLLPRRPRRIRGTSGRGHRRRQLPAAVPRARAAAKRRPATRTASSCARSPRRA